MTWWVFLEVSAVEVREEREETFSESSRTHHKRVYEQNPGRDFFSVDLVLERWNSRAQVTPEGRS